MIANVTARFGLVTTLPDASSTFTTGCCAHTAPACPPPGDVVNTNCDAVPKVIEKVVLVPEIDGPDADALNWYVVPARPVILQPAKVATPAVAFTGFDVHASPVEPGPALIANVTAVAEFTVLPNVSLTVTTGGCAHTEPDAPPPGSVVNTNCDAAAALTVINGCTARFTALPGASADADVNVGEPEAVCAVTEPPAPEPYVIVNDLPAAHA